MLWPLFALLSGTSQATGDALTKNLLSRGANRWYLAAFTFLMAGGLSLILWLGWQRTIPPERFWLAVAATGVLNVVAIQIKYHALSKGELSLVAPMLAFSPAFNIVTAWIIVGDRVSIGGSMGVLLVVAGSYILHGKPGDSLGRPLRRIFADSSARAMLLVALIYGVSTSFDKMAVQTGGVIATMTASSLVIGTMTLIAAMVIVRPNAETTRGSIQESLRGAVPLAILFGAEALLQYQALTAGAAPYVMSMKRLSILIAVLYGRLFFREAFPLRRGVGGVVMIVGHASIIFGA